MSVVVSVSTKGMRQKGIELKMNFKKELTEVLNKHSIDNKLNIPDWILADFLVDMLESLAVMETKKRQSFNVDVEKSVVSTGLSAIDCTFESPNKRGS